ncbi:MAG: T9SS type A sorting domain-containing protein [Saprospiraceae bacterium]|nr:T9SS type A sorting domain-containing protein [Candidatus Defluviibacterium haderslevense]
MILNNFYIVVIIWICFYIECRSQDVFIANGKSNINNNEKYLKDSLFTYTWDGSWRNFRKYSFDYIGGSFSGYTFFTWSVPGWVTNGEKKLEIEHDKYGNVLKEIYDSDTFTYTYNLRNSVIEKISYYNYKYSRIIYNYDSNNRLVDSTIFKRVDNLFTDPWKNLSNYKYIYDLKDNPQEEYISLWDEAINGWISTFKSVYNIDKNKKISSFITYKYDKHFNDWVIESKDTNVYNIHGRIETITTFQYDDFKEVWIPAYLETFTYDLFGNEIRYLRQVHDYLLDIWLNSYKRECYYSLHQIVSSNLDELNNKIVVYPNPARDFINIHDLPLNSEFLLYGTNGIIYLKSKLNNANSRLDLKFLPIGTYFIKSIDKNSKIYFKFVKI